MIRNSQEIIEAVRLLKNNLETCQPVSALGVDNRRQIMIMIEVISVGCTQNWIDNKYLTFPQNMREKLDNTEWRSATDAREWLDGLFDIDDLLYPDAVSQKSWATVLPGVDIRKQ
ncbi:hypothetical protein [Mucilaginibacter psychrotolerans]|uniref:Uncharacterized protein n=1 Tax=Mucilaginibacter psychrotolerans TaxID=1524096 RepID=A0A4Y8SNA7_9SPHI|nr:hypothetical protein [Mucilaginibacter psychrotolerans]TFF39816.1 hypothetical protein E2R66_05490 [Mucilaginibacter psychrotolerans]